MDVKEPIITEEIDTEEDLILYQDTTFKKNVTCRNIISKGERWNIDAGDITARNINTENITARDINAWNIDALNITAGDIDAGDIDAWDIDAENINARVIICNKRIKKSSENKTIARVFVEKINEKQKKEW